VCEYSDQPARDEDGFDFRLWTSILVKQTCGFALGQADLRLRSWKNPASKAVVRSSLPQYRAARAAAVGLDIRARIQERLKDLCVTAQVCLVKRRPAETVLPRCPRPHSRSTATVATVSG